MAAQAHFPPAVRAIYDFPGGDKIGHFLMMGTLAFLISMSVPLGPENKPWKYLLLGSALVAIASSLEEASQVYFPTRTLSLADLFANYAGVGFFAYLAWL